MLKTTSKAKKPSAPLTPEQIQEKAKADAKAYVDDTLKQFRFYVKAEVEEDRPRFYAKMPAVFLDRFKKEFGVLTQGKGAVLDVQSQESRVEYGQVLASFSAAAFVESADVAGYNWQQHVQSLPKTQQKAFLAEQLLRPGLKASVENYAAGLKAEKMNAGWRNRIEQEAPSENEIGVNC